MEGEMREDDDALKEAKQEFSQSIYSVCMSFKSVRDVYTEQEMMEQIEEREGSGFIELYQKRLGITFSEFLAQSDDFEACGPRRWRAAEKECMNSIESAIGDKSGQNKNGKSSRGRGGKATNRSERGRGGVIRGPSGRGNGFRGAFRGNRPPGNHGAAFRGPNQSTFRDPNQPKNNFCNQRPGTSSNSASRQNSEVNNSYNRPNTRSSYDRDQEFDRKQSTQNRSRCSPPPQRSPPRRNDNFHDWDNGSNNGNRNQNRDEYNNNNNRNDNGFRGNRRSDEDDLRRMSYRHSQSDSASQNNGLSVNRRPSYNLQPSSSHNHREGPNPSTSSYRDPLSHRITVSNNTHRQSSSTNDTPVKVLVDKNISNQPRIKVKVRGPRGPPNPYSRSSNEPEPTTIPKHENMENIMGEFQGMNFHTPEAESLDRVIMDGFRNFTSPTFRLTDVIEKLIPDMELNPKEIRLRVSYILFVELEGDYCYQNGSNDEVLNLLRGINKDSEANIFKASLVPRAFEEENEILKVQVARFFNFERFSVRSIEVVEQFEKMEKNIQELMLQRPDEVNEEPEGGWKPQHGCLFKLKERDSELWKWTRGYIARIDMGYFLVFLLDYGYMIMAKREDLRLLPQKFIDLPPYAVSCTSATEEDDDSESLIEKWKKTINGYSDKTFLKIHESDTKDGIPTFKTDILVENLARKIINILELHDS